jgi:hypothetical protein
MRVPDFDVPAPSLVRHSSRKMACKKLVKREEQYFTALVGQLSGALYCKNRFARSGRSPDNRSRIGSHSPRRADLGVRQLEEAVIETGKVWTTRTLTIPRWSIWCFSSAQGLAS